MVPRDLWLSKRLKIRHQIRWIVVSAKVSKNYMYKQLSKQNWFRNCWPRCLFWAVSLHKVHVVWPSKKMDPEEWKYDVSQLAISAEEVKKCTTRLCGCWSPQLRLLLRSELLCWESGSIDYVYIYIYIYIQCRVLVFFLDCYGHVKPSSLRKTNSEGCWNVFQMAAPQIHKMKNEARICSCPFQICMNLPPKVMNHWCVLTKSHNITRVSEKSWSWVRRNLELAPVEDATLYHLKRFLGLSQAVQDLRTINRISLL